MLREKSKPNCETTEWKRVDIFRRIDTISLHYVTDGQTSRIDKGLKTGQNDRADRWHDNVHQFITLSYWLVTALRPTCTCARIDVLQSLVNHHCATTQAKHVLSCNIIVLLQRTTDRIIGFMTFTRLLACIMLKVLLFSCYSRKKLHSSHVCKTSYPGVVCCKTI